MNGVSMTWSIRFRLAAALLMAAPCGPAIAQTSTNENVDAIIGSEVREEEVRGAFQPEAVIAAIEKTAESIEAVRKASKLDRVDIVFLTDSAKSEGGPPPAIKAKIKEHEKDIAELRNEIEGNAMIYRAIDSRQILVEDVIAVAFADPGKVVIYAAAKPSGG